MSLTILKKKYIRDCEHCQFLEPGNNALKAGIIDDTLHGVGFSTGSLSVSKDGSIVARQHICKYNYVTLLLKYTDKPFTIFLAVAS